MEKKLELYELFEKMIDVLGEETLLEDLFDALSGTQLEEYLQYIADMRDISYLYEKYL